MSAQLLVEAKRINSTQARGPCPFCRAAEHVYDLADKTGEVIWVRSVCDHPRARDQFGLRKPLALRIIEEEPR